jgi:uncharacterized lipoprotein YddW (UPF0748 family)
MFKKISTFILLLIHISAFGQEKISPKREFRAVWISSVVNLDFPSNKKFTTSQQQKEFVKILDEHQKNGMNAVIVQVRPAGDALYPSSLAPWSEWLSDKQGEMPKPYYDPLSFMIKEAHKRGMEFHAWFNPFRAAFNISKIENLSAKNIYHKQKDWFVNYGNQAVFNPGIPEVREHIVEVISEVVMRYDIDAVHLDDYFYPYPNAKNGDFMDTLAYKTYRDGTLVQYDSLERIAHWRRNNINSFVKTLSKAIKNIKPYVKFGISPFGVWRNKKEDPNGSETFATMTCYDQLYADTKLWLEKGWLDYLAPQIYFSRGYKVVPYGNLLEWWTKNSFSRHIYIGQAAYKINNNHDKNWENPAEVPKQIRLNRTYSEAKGSIFFRSKLLNDNPLHIQDSLRTNLYRLPALVPKMEWLDNIAPASPKNVLVFGSKKGLTLHWEVDKANNPMNEAVYYVIYRFDRKAKFDIENPKNIIAIHRSESLFFTDPHVRKKKKYVYQITAVDRLHNESKPSEARLFKYKKKYLRK